MFNEIAALCIERKIWIATAESATGGLIAHTLTNVPGSSAYFRGGIVAYSNEIKMKILGVRRETLDCYGAVSEQTAMEMSKGAYRIMDADVAIATTGIAGPSGGTPAKPVGLVYISWITKSKSEVRRFLFSGDRIRNKMQFCTAALTMLLEVIQSD